MDRRDFIKYSFLTTANLGFLDLPEFSYALPTVTYRRQAISIGIFSPSHCAAPLIFAEKKGYFKDSGLKVELINYPTMSTLAKDLLRGRIEFGQLTVPLIFSIHTGTHPSWQEHKLVMPMILGVHGSNLMISNDSKIVRPIDFKGKTIATHTKLTVHYLLVRLYLQQNNVDTETDVQMTIVDLKDLPEVLHAGKIDAFMMPEPINALAEETNKANTYILNQFIWRYHPCCGLASRRDYFITEEYERTEALVSAISKASLYINKEVNREELVSVLLETQYGFEALPQKVIDLAFAFSRSSFYPFPYQSTAALLLKLMHDYDLLPSMDMRRVAREVFLSDFMRTCLAKIGKRAPRTNYRPEIVLGRRFELET